LAKKTGHNAVNLDMNRRRQTSRSLLYDHIFSIAETLAKASETVKGEPNNKVSHGPPWPVVCRGLFNVNDLCDCRSLPVLV
jgi:hypothetical protein